MRSSPLLLLLITTQCCFIYHTCVDASTEETVGDKSRVNGRNASIPTPEELGKLKTRKLENKVKALEKEKNATAKEKNRIESELNKLMSDWKTANQTYIDAEKKWRETKEDLIEKEKPYKKLTEDREQKESALKRTASALQIKNKDAKVPINVKDIQEWTKAELSSLDENGRTESLSISEINDLRDKLKEAESEVSPVQKSYDAAHDNWQDLGCSESADAEHRRLRRADCAELLKIVNAEKLKWEAAMKKESTARRNLEEAKVELEYLQTLERLQQEAIDYGEARVKEHNASKSTSKIVTLVGILNKAMENAKALLPDFANSVTLLEGQLEVATKALANVEAWYDAYQAANIKKKEEIEESKLIKSSFPLMEVIIAAVGGLIVLVLIIVGVVCAKKRCKKKSRPVNDNDISARTIKSADSMRLDSNDFEYATIVLCDVYDGDLPHKKMSESVEKLPTSYKLVKKRMKFYFYGLKEDIPIVTGKKIPSMKDFNFQPEIFSSIDEKEIASYLEKFEGRDILSSPLEFGAGIATLGKRPSKVPTMNPTTMRSEFICYLHAMASRSYNDNKDDDDFSSLKDLKEEESPFNFKHIIWIFANVKQVLKECHTSALCKYDGSIVIVGDLHGQFPDLLRMFGQRATKDSPGWLNHNYLFMGNYIETGTYSLETIIFLFLLKILYPKHIILLRGFREQICTWDRQKSSGLSKELIDGYGKTKGDILKKAFAEVLGYLPISAVLNGNIFCSNFGIGRTLIDEGSKDKPLDYHYNKIPYPMNELNKNHAEELKKQSKGTMLFYDTLGGKPKGQKHEEIDLFNLEEGNLQKFKWLYDIKLVFTAEVAKDNYPNIDPNGIHFPFDETYMKIISAPDFSREDNRAATVDIDLSGRIGVSICARYKKITNKALAFMKFKQYNTAGVSMEGPSDDSSRRSEKKRNVSNHSKVEAKVEEKVEKVDDDVEDKAADRKIIAEYEKEAAQAKEQSVRRKNKKKDTNQEFEEKTCIDPDEEMTCIDPSDDDEEFVESCRS